MQLNDVMSIILLVAVVGGTPQSTAVNHRNGQCRLKDVENAVDWDFGSHKNSEDRRTAMGKNDMAVKVSFGHKIRLMTFSYSQSSRKKTVPTELHVTALTENLNGEDVYRGYGIAFLDSAGNLVAGESTCDNKTSRAFRRLRLQYGPSLRMPVPHGAHDRVTAYRAVYCESVRPIGDMSQGKESLADNKAAIHDSARNGSSILVAPPSNNWTAEFQEGPCTIKNSRDAIPDDADLFRIRVGAKLAFQGYYDVCINSDRNKIDFWPKVRNNSNKTMFGQAYVAFFDKSGNLVTTGGSAYDSEGVAAGEEGNFSISFSPIPLGYGETITSFKLVIYESPSPIGTEPEIRDTHNRR